MASQAWKDLKVGIWLHSKCREAQVWSREDDCRAAQSRVRSLSSKDRACSTKQGGVMHWTLRASIRLGVASQRS